MLFQIAVTAHITRPRLRRRVFIFSPFAILGLLALIAVVSIFVSADWGRALATGFSALLTAGVIIRIFARIAKAPVVNIYVVYNAITVYLMLGLLFSYIFLTAEDVKRCRRTSACVTRDAPALEFTRAGYLLERVS